MNFKKLTIKDNEYKIVLTTRTLCELEDKLGYNPIDILIKASEGIIPKVSEMVYVLWASSIKYNHSVSLNAAYDIFDDYIAEGHSYTDFIEVMVDIFRASGLVPEENEAEEENPN